MRASASDEGLYATDLAEALVRGGVPFREAHRRTGEVLRALASRSRTMRDLTPDEWETFGLPDGATMLDPDVSMRSRTMPGGPSTSSVAAQVDAISAALGARPSGP